MHEYDVALKLLLRRSASLTMRERTGGIGVANWLDVVLPRVQNPRVDLLGRASHQSLIHIELQSTNESHMPLGMAEYCLGIYRLLGRFPRQMCLYIGEAPLRMPSELRGYDLWFRYSLIDIRNLEGEPLLESPDIGDTVLAILAHLRKQKGAVRSIISKMRGLPEDVREMAFSLLLTLSSLRHLEQLVEQEIRKMPVHMYIMQNKVLRRECKRGPAGRKARRPPGRRSDRASPPHRKALRSAARLG
jgi:hypothetical protein